MNCNSDGVFEENLMFYFSKVKTNNPPILFVIPHWYPTVHQIYQSFLKNNTMTLVSCSLYPYAAFPMHPQLFHGTQTASNSFLSLCFSDRLFLLKQEEEKCIDVTAWMRAALNHSLQRNFAKAQHQMTYDVVHILKYVSNGIHSFLSHAHETLLFPLSVSRPSNRLFKKKEWDSSSAVMRRLNFSCEIPGRKREILTHTHSVHANVFFTPLSLKSERERDNLIVRNSFSVITTRRWNVDRTSERSKNIRDSLDPDFTRESNRTPGREISLVFMQFFSFFLYGLWFCFYLFFASRRLALHNHNIFH